MKNAVRIVKKNMKLGSVVTGGGIQMGKESFKTFTGR